MQVSCGQRELHAPTAPGTAPDDVCGEEEAWAQKPMEQLTEGQQEEQRFPLHLNANLITKGRESPIEKQKIFIYSIMVKRKPLK